jgi:hypothetical protein
VTDQADYPSWLTAYISGTGFSPNTSYALPVLRPDGSILTGAGTSIPGWDTVTTNSSGAFTYSYILNGIDGSYVARAYPASWSGNWTQTPVASVTFLDSSAGSSQCTNGQVGPPLTLEPCAGSNSTTTVTIGGNSYKNWVSGDANGSKAHWAEGEFISYRTTLSSISAGAHILLISYSPVQSGKHAIDYLGSYDTTETTSTTSSARHYNNNTPCQDLVAISLMPSSECGAPASPIATATIPSADLAGANAANCGATGSFSGTEVAGTMDLFGAAGSSIGPITYASQNVSSGTGSCDTTVQIPFSIPSALGAAQAIVISFGGHISSQLDWGAGNSASSINGSPYHITLGTLDGASQGAKSLALATSAIVLTPSLSTGIINNGSSANVTNATVALGTTVHDTATLSGASSTASGSVTYSFYSAASCSGIPSTQSVSVTGASVPPSSNEGPLAAGSYSFSAAYSGDASNLPATSPCENLTVSMGTSSTSTTLRNASGGATIAVGSSLPLNTSVYDTSAVTPSPSAFTPQGSVTYSFYANSTCTGTPTSTQSVTLLSSGTVPDASASGALSAGSYAFQAAYSGDSNYSGSTSSCENFSVGQAAQTITFTSSAPVGATVGGTYIVTATASSGLPVTFSSATPSVCTVSGSTVTLIGTGTCVIDANQAGNSNYSAAPQVQQSFVVTNGSGGGGGGGGGTGGGGPQPTLDHFLCYTAGTVSAKGVPGFTPPATLGLENAYTSFSTGPATVTAHCNPVAKTLPNGHGTTVTNPEAHQLCWGISAKKQSFTVPVTNQFGSAQISASQPSSLCLPSWKSASGPPNQSPDVPAGLDNYVCYAAGYASGTAPFSQIPKFVVLHDEFGTLKTTIGAITQLCIPTQTTVDGVVTDVSNPSGQVCFAVTAKPKHLKVFDENQFGTGRLSVTQALYLCLPSTVPF